MAKTEQKKLVKQPDKQAKKEKLIKNFKGAKFEKGKSGNPNGRPKKEFAIASILQKIGNEKVDYELNGKVVKISYKEVVLRTAYIQATQGDKDARNFIADRTEGKALERILTKETTGEIEIL